MSEAGKQKEQIEEITKKLEESKGLPLAKKVLRTNSTSAWVDRVPDSFFSRNLNYISNKVID